MDAPLATLFDFLRFPSISTSSRHAADTRACGGWLARLLGDNGFQAELWETPGQPVVFAQGPQVEGAPTLLVYGHYDVQPVDPLALWETQPFEPALRDGKIWARGATDNKGQILAHVLGAIQVLRERGELPVNLKFLVEGEEEIGSVNLPALLREKRAELACDVIAVSDTGMVAPDTPTFGYGLRGIACLEFTVRGPKGDLHSGVYGGGVLNPATVAARLIASLHDDNWRVAIPGFYDGVREVQPWEHEAFARLADGDAEMRRHAGAAPAGEAGRSTWERLGARPTAEVNGLWGGYQGEGSKTVLPAEAHAKLSFRLVPGQDPQRILELAAAHLREHCPAEVTLEIHPGHTGPSYFTDPHSRWGKAAQQALRATFPGKDIAFVLEGGSIPIVATMKEVLGAEVLLLGLALPDAQIHAPNENFPVGNFEAGIRLHGELLRAVGEA